MRPSKGARAGGGRETIVSFGVALTIVFAWVNTRKQATDPDLYW